MINAVGKPRVIINGTALDFLAESFMAGDPLDGGGFAIVNGIRFDENGNVVPLPLPYAGGNLLSLASGGRPAVPALGAARFRALGTPRVEVCGNLKFDAPPPAADPAELNHLSRAIGKRPVLLAASTHEGEEELVLEAHGMLASKIPDLLTIIAPRHPERGDEVADLAEARGLAVRQRGLDEDPDAGTGIYVADTIGEMGLFYRLAQVVFMGGSLVEHGGQNPIEPAKLGSVVLHGPHVWNFDAIYQQLDADQGAAEVADALGIARAAYALLMDVQLHGRMADAAHATVTALGGALDRTLSAVEPYLIQIRLEAR